MITSDQIFNFLTKQAEEILPVPEPISPNVIPSPTPLAVDPVEDARIEGLRTRMRALIGTVSKKASDSSDTVFSDKPGTPDPDAQDLSPEHWEALANILGDLDIDFTENGEVSKATSYDRPKPK